MCGSHRETWRRWCGGALMVTLSVIYLEFKAHLTSMATTAVWSDTPFYLVCTVFQQDNNPKHTSKLCKGYFTKKGSDGAASDDLASTITQPQPNWDGLGWVGPQSEGKAANKYSANVGTPSRLLEKHSRWSWLRECQVCAKLSSRQRVATLKNITYILICLTLFWLLQDSMCVIS